MGLIDNISAELARLRRENDALRADLASTRSVYDFAALEARIAELRAAATNLMAAIDNMHERGETFTARVSIAASDMRQALEQKVNGDV